MPAILHVTNGDAVVPELAAAVGVEPGDVLVWRDILHDGPVPAGLGPADLARVRARHVAARQTTPGSDPAESAQPAQRAEPAQPAGPSESAQPAQPAGPSESAQPAQPAGPSESAQPAGPSEASVLELLRERDRRLAAHPRTAEIALWFEDDLYDALQLAQIEDRLAGRLGPVTRVRLPHPPRGDLRSALAAREPIEPDPGAFAALRSPDPRAWLAVPAFERLLEELPDVRTGLGRTERQILDALRAGPLAPHDLFPAVAQHEDPPWLGDDTVYALAQDLDPLVAFAAGKYELTAQGEAVLAGTATRPPIDRWLGGVHLGPGHPDWAWDPAARRPVRLD